MAHKKDYSVTWSLMVVLAILGGLRNGVVGLIGLGLFGLLIGFLIDEYRNKGGPDVEVVEVQEKTEWTDEDEKKVLEEMRQDGWGVNAKGETDKSDTEDT